VKRDVVAVLVAAVLLLTVSCTFHRARIDYEADIPEMPIRGESWNGEMLGHLAYNEGGAIWNDCTKSATTSLWVVIDDAQRMGGNAIGNIRWIPKKESGNTDRPTCRKGWAWLLLWPVTATKVFMSSRVEADVYKVSDSAALRPGVYRIPETENGRTALVTRLLSESD